MLTNTILPSEAALAILACLVKSAYLSDLIVAKARIAMLFTLGVTVSSFLIGVSVVLGNRAKPKMFRVNTGRIIVSTRAVMQNIHVFRDWAKMQLPGNAVGKSGRTSARNLKTSVAKLCLSRLPYPAGIFTAAAIHFGPKAIFYVTFFAVPRNSQNVMIPDPPISLYGFRGDRRHLPTATLAQPVAQWIKTEIGRHIDRSLAVVVYMAVGLTFLYATIQICPCGDVCLFATTTLALAVLMVQSVFGDPRGVILKVLREIGSWRTIAHVASPFLTIGHAAGLLQAIAAALLLGNNSSILPHFALAEKG